MAIVIPKVFRKSGDYSANYDYFDLSARTGYKTFYVSKGNSGAYMVVPENNVYSEQVATYGSTDLATETIYGRTYYKKLDLNIDLQFNVPTNLKGDMFFNVPITLDGTTTLHYYLCKLSAYHYDGTTETQIGSEVTSREYSLDTDDPTNDGAYTAVAQIKINTVSTRHFKRGEYLRVKLKVYNTSSGWTSGLAHDPAGRLETNTGYAGGEAFFDAAGTITTFSWLLPFKLDT